MKEAGLLTYSNRRYMWWAILLASASLVLYGTQPASALQPPNGGTWQGYILGSMGALLIVWLSLLGIRKRRYRSRLGSVAGWASAHVYLGLALLVVATLHCALQFGWNVHTLAYVLMCGVILSGAYGLVAYVRLPDGLSRNAAGKNIEDWVSELGFVDQEIQSFATKADAELQAAVVSALSLTEVGHSIWARLWGVDRSMVQFGTNGVIANSGQQAMIDHLADCIPKARTRREAQVLNDLLDGFGRRKVILARMREELRLRSHLRIWLFFHIPLTVALLAALTVHIVVVFLYW